MKQLEKQQRDKELQKLDTVQINERHALIKKLDENYELEKVDKIK